MPSQDSMPSNPSQREDASCDAYRNAAAWNLVNLLTPLLLPNTQSSSATFQQGILPEHGGLPTTSCKEILSAIQALVPTLTPNSPFFAMFHDGEVHNPLGSGSYAFQTDIISPVLQALVNDEVASGNEKYHLDDDGTYGDNSQNGSMAHHKPGKRVQTQLPTRPIVIHAGLQPNNSPHVGTLVVFCYAFSFARGIHDRMQAMVANTNKEAPPVSVEITFVDTAPVKRESVEIGGIEYQRSYRDVPGAMSTYMADYEEVLHLLSTWSGIVFTTAFQCDLFSHPAVPLLVHYIVTNHDLLGYQMSPKFGTLGLRAACPTPGCTLAEKHGILNTYEVTNLKNANASPAVHEATISFHCPHHGPHTICTSEPAQVTRLEANTPARNLIRSMSHLLDKSTHNVRVTGADYAGTYQEMFLYRPLAAWSATTGMAAGRTPIILYAPLIVDWSGAKLSKTLYIREGGYDAMALFGTDWLCSFARLKSYFGDSSQGLGSCKEPVGSPTS
ncbi:hypothetical protein ACHAP5_010021 [Fusarium lateritium]